MRTKNPASKLDYRAIDGLIDGIANASRSEIETAERHLKDISQDFIYTANKRAIAKKLLTLVRGIKRQFAGPRRKSNPAHEVRELILYADNTAELQNQKNSIIQNLQRKVKRGVYDPAKAAKLWQYLVDNAVKYYNREFLGGGLSLRQNVFTMADRKQAAAELEEQYRAGIHYQNNPAKKKRTTKKRTTKKRTAKKRTAKKRSSNPRRKGTKLYNIFLHSPTAQGRFGRVFFLGEQGTNLMTYTPGERNLAWRFMSQQAARDKLSTLLNYTTLGTNAKNLGWQTGVVSDETTIADIARELKYAGKK